MKMVGYLFQLLVSFIIIIKINLMALFLVPKLTSPNNDDGVMANSWIESPPIMRTDQSPSINRSSSPNIHHFNPIENLLIEHASTKKK